MYRVTSHILSSKSILYCRPAIEYQLKSVSRCGPQLKYVNPTERDTCVHPLPPPPPPPKDYRAVWRSALAVLVLAGGFAYYAKKSPELRDWLSLHAPWFDDFIAIAYEENMSYKEFAELCAGDIKKYMNSYFDDTKPKQCSLDGENVKPIEEAPPPQKESKTKEGCQSDKGKETQEKTKCDAINKGICDVEVCLKELGEELVNNYITARDACIYYNKLTEETMSDFCMTKLKELHESKAERKDLIRQSLENITTAGGKMDELVRYVECGGVQAPEDELDILKCVISNIRLKISEISREFEWENFKALAMDDQVNRVEELVLKCIEENQMLFPGLQFDAPKPVLHGDPDLLLFQNVRFVNKLRNELSIAAPGMTDRIDRALETLSQDPKDLKKRNNEIQAEYKKRKAAMDKDFKRRVEEQKAMNARIMQKARQGQDKTLEDKLLQKEKEVSVILNKLVAEKVAAEKKAFATKLAEMAAKLKIVEDKINARLKAERDSRRSQELWAAGSSLLAATQKGDPIVKVDKELKAIEKASTDDDKLVQTVLKSIPQSVRTNGVVPESILKERYHRMENAALRVALVEQDGGPLPVFLLSWLQSMMLFMKLSSIPQAEADKPPQEPSKDLDTFDLLQRARYWIERGNLAAALRYVSSLEGASRLAASTWYNQARSHLETRQAAEAVLAHAAALGLQYV